MRSFRIDPQYGGLAKAVLRGCHRNRSGDLRETRKAKRDQRKRVAAKRC